MYNQDYIDEIEKRLRRIIEESYEMGFADGKATGDPANVFGERRYNSGKELADNVIKASLDA